MRFVPISSRAISLILLYLACTATAHAQNTRLKGAYAFAGSTSCVVSELPFGDDGQPPNPQFALTGNGSLVGTFTFAGNGTGNAELNTVTVINGTTPGSASERDSAKFSYTVSGNTIQIQLANVAASYLTGPEAGLNATIDNIIFSGGISADGKILVIGEAEPLVETAAVSDGTTLYSICAAAGTMTKK